MSLLRRMLSVMGALGVMEALGFVLPVAIYIWFILLVALAHGGQNVQHQRARSQRVFMVRECGHKKRNSLNLAQAGGSVGNRQYGVAHQM